VRDRTSQRVVRYPVRGDMCTHGETFDYLAALEYFSLYGDRFVGVDCLVCDKRCDRVVVDRFLWEKLK